MSEKVVSYFNGDTTDVTFSRNVIYDTNDIIGNVYSMLTVVSYEGVKKCGTVKQFNKRLYKVKCKCGIEKIVTRDALTGGTTRSCGCVRSKKLLDRQIANRLPDGLSIWKCMFNAHVKNAVDRKLINSLTIQEYIAICSKDCYYCGISPKQKKWQNIFGSVLANGIDRIDNNLGYILDNSRTCCEYCNRMKLNKTEEQFYLQIKMIYEKHLNKL